MMENEESPTGPIRILAVDDEKAIRRLLQKELSSPCRDVVTTGSAADALELISRLAFDVVILDIRLPDGNGMEIMAECFKRLADVAVILITGQGTIESAMEAMKMGAYDFIAKPFNLDRLEAVVERAYRQVCLRKALPTV